MRLQFAMLSDNLYFAKILQEHSDDYNHDSNSHNDNGDRDDHNNDRLQDNGDDLDDDRHEHNHNNDDHNQDIDHQCAMPAGIVFDGLSGSVKRTSSGPTIRVCRLVWLTCLFLAAAHHMCIMVQHLNVVPAFQCIVGIAASWGILSQWHCANPSACNIVSMTVAAVASPRVFPFQQIAILLAGMFPAFPPSRSESAQATLNNKDVQRDNRATTNLWHPLRVFVLL